MYNYTKLYEICPYIIRFNYIPYNTIERLQRHN